MTWFDKWISKKISTPSGFVLAGAFGTVASLWVVCWIAYMLGGP